MLIPLQPGGPYVTEEEYDELYGPGAARRRMKTVEWSNIILTVVIVVVVVAAIIGGIVTLVWSHQQLSQ